jgi:hypothetical protein
MDIICKLVFLPPTQKNMELYMNSLTTQSHNFTRHANWKQEKNKKFSVSIFFLLLAAYQNKKMFFFYLNKNIKSKMTKSIFYL